MSSPAVGVRGGLVLFVARVACMRLAVGAVEVEPG
jgi:hypothetical protein